MKIGTLYRTGLLVMRILLWWRTGVASMISSWSVCLMMDVVVWCGAVGRQAISIILYQRAIFPQQTKFDVEICSSNDYLHGC